MDWFRGTSRMGRPPNLGLVCLQLRKGQSGSLGSSFRIFISSFARCSVTSGFFVFSKPVGFNVEYGCFRRFQAKGVIHLYCPLAFYG